MTKEAQGKRLPGHPSPALSPLWRWRRQLIWEVPAMWGALFCLPHPYPHHSGFPSPCGIEGSWVSWRHGCLTIGVEDPDVRAKRTVVKK